MHPAARELQPVSASAPPPHPWAQGWVPGLGTAGACAWRRWGRVNTPIQNPALSLR